MKADLFSSQGKKLYILLQFTVRKDLGMISPKNKVKLSDKQGAVHISILIQNKSHHLISVEANQLPETVPSDIYDDTSHCSSHITLARNSQSRGRRGERNVIRDLVTRSPPDPCHRVAVEGEIFAKFLLHLSPGNRPEVTFHGIQFTQFEVYLFGREKRAQTAFDM